MKKFICLLVSLFIGFGCFAETKYLSDGTPYEYHTNPYKGCSEWYNKKSAVSDFEIEIFVHYDNNVIVDYYLNSSNKCYPKKDDSSVSMIFDFFEIKNWRNNKGSYIVRVYVDGHQEDYFFFNDICYYCPIK